ncbi:hypothetical protein [Alicyclobacillus fodiniaquatilis]|uniref:Stage III sporulation protein AC n=1 Tax=Alicyclobacillus fodiniaquatilis TaxID=1661150 RepID=A0ABW4JES1_9BACL
MDFISTGITWAEHTLQAIFLCVAVYRGVRLYAHGEQNRLWGHIILSCILAIFVFFPSIAEFLAQYLLKQLGISLSS